MNAERKYIVTVLWENSAECNLILELDRKLAADLITLVEACKYVVDRFTYETHDRSHMIFDSRYDFREWFEAAMHIDYRVGVNADDLIAVLKCIASEIEYLHSVVEQFDEGNYDSKDVVDDVISAMHNIEKQILI